MLGKGKRPRNGVKESCIAFTSPQEEYVVIVAKRAEFVIPKRTSLPSILPFAGLTPSAVTCGLPAASQPQQMRNPTTNTSAIVIQTAHPCFWLFTILPKY